MPKFEAKTLEEWTQGRWENGLPESVTGFCHDTRILQHGQCFIALKTEKRDGHDFLHSAEEAGASCALVDRVVPDSNLCQLVVTDTLKAFQEIGKQHRLDFKGHVIGITGSCGKTTTKELLATLLGPRTLRTEGNLNNFIGVPLTLTRLDNDLHDQAVIEAGINEPGEMDMLAQMIDADASLFTMIGPAHLEKLQDVETIAYEKSRLAAHGKPDAAVLCSASCMAFNSFKELGDRAWVATPPGETEPSGSYHRISYWTESNELDGCRLNIEPAALLAGTYDIPFISQGLISNAALAITAAQLCGVSQQTIIERLTGWKPWKNRGYWKQIGPMPVYDDSYNANPASMIESMSAFAASAPEGMPRLFVLGGMMELGEKSPELHQQIGAKVPWREGDRIVLVGKEAPDFLTGILSAGIPQTNVDVYGKTEDALGCLNGFEGAVFLKGSRAYALEQLLEGLNCGQEVPC